MVDDGPPPASEIMPLSRWTEFLVWVAVIACLHLLARFGR